MTPPPPFPTSSATPAQQADAEHLNLLAIFHFVMAGFAAFGLVVVGLQFALFRVFVLNAVAKPNAYAEPIPAEVKLLFLGFMIFFTAYTLVLGVANLLSGMFIKRRQHRTFSQVVAGFNCLHIPLGTALGVFTFIVLQRESVRALYDRPPGI